MANTEDRVFRGRVLARYTQAKPLDVHDLVWSHHGPMGLNVPHHLPTRRRPDFSVGHRVEDNRSNVAISPETLRVSR